jgi:nucleoside-diphosphate-sugar epimerase
MKIAISGTNGLIGRNLSSYLKKKKIKLIKLQNKEKKGTFKWRLGEVLPSQVLSSNIFIHCAFDRHSLNIKENLEKNINIIGLIKILNQLKKKKILFFYISSQTSHKNIESNYGKIKFLSEKIIKKNQGNKNIIIKAGIIYSRSQSNVINYLKKILSFGLFFYFSKKKNIYPISIDDFCECIYKIIKLKKIDKNYNLGWPNPLSIIDFAKFICRDNNIKYPFFIYVSKDILIFFASILDFFNFSNISLVERIKSLDTMPLLKCKESIKKIRHFFLKNFTLTYFILFHFINNSSQHIF